MHVGLNLLFLVPGDTGGLEVYARELLLALAAERPDLRLTSFVNREAAAAGGPWEEQTGVVVVGVNGVSRVARVRAEQGALPRLGRRAGIDVLHSLASTAPVLGDFARVVTIHDLHYRILPEAHFGVYGLGMRVLVPLAGRRSDRVIAISEATAADIRRYLHVPADRLDVVPSGLGLSPDAARVPEPEEQLREKLALGRRPVALSVSAKRPHKNLMRLLEALAAIPPARRPILVVPGYPTPYERELRARAAGLGVLEDLRMLDWVSDAELEGLYALSAVFVFPSLAEGFGLPVLEAMARGVPVVCSNTSSLPEIAGDAALQFDPLDVSTIAAAMERVLGDGELAGRLRAAGPPQAAQFSWARAARETAASYERALTGRRG